MPCQTCQKGRWCWICSILSLALCTSRVSARKDYAVYINAGLRDFKAKVYVWEALSYTPENLPPKLVVPGRLGRGVTMTDAENCDVRDELCRIHPSFLDREGNLREHISAGLHERVTKLLDWCQAKLREEKLTDEDLRKVPLFVTCSASLQKIPKQKREDLIAKVRELFMGSESVSPFLRNPNFAFLLSAKEEAVYTWLASNGLLGSLGSTQTYGIVTMSRDSSGIAFQAYTNDLLLTSTYEVKLTNLAGHWKTMKGNPSWPGTIRLYAHSYNYLGRDVFVERMNAKVVEIRGPGTDVVSHPCMPKGASPEWDRTSNKFLPKDFGDKPSGFTGTSDFDQCYASVRNLLALDSHRPCFVGEWPYNDCALDGEYHPTFSANQKFLAIRGFDQFAQFMSPILQDNGYYHPWTLSDLFQGCKKICEMDYDEIKAYRKNKLKERHLILVTDGALVNSCMLVTFSYSFLVDGLGFKDTSRALVFLNYASKNYTFTVADGLILKHVNQLPWKLNLDAEADVQKEIGVPAFGMGFVGSLIGYSLVVMVMMIRRRMK